MNNLEKILVQVFHLSHKSNLNHMWPGQGEPLNQKSFPLCNTFDNRMFIWIIRLYIIYVYVCCGYVHLDLNSGQWLQLWTVIIFILKLTVLNSILWFVHVIKWYSFVKKEDVTLSASFLVRVIPLRCWFSVLLLSMGSTRKAPVLYFRSKIIVVLVQLLILSSIHDHRRKYDIGRT